MSPGRSLVVVSAKRTLAQTLRLGAASRATLWSKRLSKRDRTRWLIRCGEAPANGDADRPVGSRLWLYTNFDCNLHCDYCCVRSSPKAPRRELGLARVRADRRRSSRTRRPRNFRDRRRTVSARGHRRDPGCVLRCRADHGTHQRHAVLRTAAPNAAFIAERSLDAADQPRQSDARTTRPPSWKGHMGARIGVVLSALAPKGSGCDWQRPSPLMLRPRSSVASSMTGRSRKRTG